MGSRLELHEELVEVLGSRNVYFQPPESVKLQYPCIVYRQGSGKAFRANDRLYNHVKSYELTYVTTDPDTDVPFKLLSKFQLIDFNRFYVADNLNHYSLTLYF